ncbi:sensor histidine kinase [Rhodoblastus sp.]|uniref:sensor histidine kinase n=1 Tax=Rhodoblastus sp. TaxID=1962975 RepID=UPI003F957022
MSIWDWLLNPAGLTPHGFCLSWAPGLVWLHAASDAITGLAYFSVPLALASFARQRRDLQYGWVIYLFVAFILACGATHLMSILTLWLPVYGVEGIIKLITAVASIATAILLWPMIPKLVALPSPAKLESLNAELKATIAEQQHTATLLKESESRARASNLSLERRVDDQTAELRNANTHLTEALEQRTAALEQRDVLLREVYHRVKNNLQIIDALLAVQAGHFHDTDSASALLDLRQRVYALGLVHQQLMDSKDLKTFDIAPFLQELADNIIETSVFPEVKVSVHAISLTVGLDFAIPLGLLVTELLTNSLRHAFPTGAGNIAVVLARNEEQKLALTVSDDGRGQAPNKISSAVPKAGCGMKIISGLVAQLRGTITVRNEGGMRTEICVAEPALA